MNEAMLLFSSKGFNPTTIGDIEKAAGLTPRAGGFYRHFKSKQAILREVVDSTEAHIFAQFNEQLLLPLGNLRADILMIGRMILYIGEQCRPLRIILRSEVKNFPEILDKMKAINSRLPEEFLIPWLRKSLKNTAFETTPIDEMLQIVFGSVFYYMMSLDIDPTPYGIEQEKFLQSWADVWTTSFAS